MEVTALYWRQLYLHLSRQQKKRQRIQRQIALRAVAAEVAFRPVRYVSSPRRPFSAPN